MKFLVLLFLGIDVNWCTVGKPWALDLGKEVDSFRAFCYIIKLSKPEPLRLASLAINWESQ